MAGSVICMGIDGRPVFRGLACLLWLLCGICTSAWAGDKPELVFLTWEDYIDPALLAEFEQANGCTVRRVYYDDDDERNMILANTNATGFDLVTVDHIIVDSYRKRDWLRPLTYAQIPHAKLARNPWQEDLPLPEPFYAVPYLWGGIGIVYRKDLVQPPPTRWRDLFQPAPYLRGHIMLLDTVQFAYGLALLSQGHSFNSTDPAEVADATRALLDVRPYVHAFRNIRIGPDSELLAESVYAAATYNGDAMMLMEFSDKIGFVFPAEGTPLWLDQHVILKNARQPELAQKLLDFLNRPEIAARNSLTVKYAPANLGALKLLPDSFLQDQRIFPDRTDPARNQPYVKLPTDHLRRITAQMVQIMATEPAQ